MKMGPQSGLRRGTWRRTALLCPQTGAVWPLEGLRTELPEAGLRIEYPVLGHRIGHRGEPGRRTECRDLELRTVLRPSGLLTGLSDLRIKLLVLKDRLWLTGRQMLGQR